MDKNSIINDEKKSYDPFTVKDRETGASYYGGNQEWYSSNTMAYAGCGSVAAANMLRMLAQRYPEAFAAAGSDRELNTVKDKEPDKDSFLRLMSSIYDSMLVFEFPVVRRIYDMRKRGKKLLKIIPPSFGMSLNGFVRGTLKYCEDRGVLLHAHALTTAFRSYDEGLDFIRKGLEESGAVVMLTSLNRHPLKLYGGRSGELEKGYDSKKGVASHFMTITGIIEDKDGTAPLIKLSTWGRVATVPYDVLNRSWFKLRAYTSCLYYFTPAESDAVVRADIRNSYRLPVNAVIRGLFGRFMKKS